MSIRALSLLLTLLLVGPGCAPRRWLSAQPLSGVAAAARRTVDGDLLIRLQIENRTGAVIEFDPAEIQVFALARGSEQRVPLWQPQEYLLELERWNQGASDLDSMLTDAELQPAHSNLGIGPDQRVNLGSLDMTRGRAQARRNRELEAQGRAFRDRLQALSAKLLWPTTLLPGQSAAGLVAGPAAAAPQYRIELPVGATIRHITLVQRR